MYPNIEILTQSKYLEQYKPAVDRSEEYKADSDEFEKVSLDEIIFEDKKEEEPAKAEI